MMEATQFYFTIALTTLMAVAMMSVMGFKAFSGWLDLKRAELDMGRRHDAPAPSTSSRIEIADLKERLRKLEAIAAGVDL
jgi:high-affinity Fe2+/Pb2+ permease